MDSNSKHSLYRLASPPKRGILQQGKLQELSSIVTPPPATWSTNSSTPPPPTITPGPPPFWSDDDDNKKSSHESTVGRVAGGSPRRPPPPPTPPHTATPSGHTHSLSLSNSSDESPSDHHTHTVSEPHPPTHIVPASPTPATLLVSAEHGDTLPSHSTEVKVSSVQIHSPVKVVRHGHHGNDRESDQQWRRFSSDFASLRDDQTIVEHEKNTSHDQQDLSHDQTLRSHDQISESHDHLSQSSLSTITNITEDSINIDDVRTALDSLVVTEGDSSGMVGSKKSGGIGRSISEEAMKTKPVDDSVHSRSVDSLSTIHEDSMLGTTTKRGQSKKGRVVQSRYMSTVKKTSTQRNNNNQRKVTHTTSKRQPLKKMVSSGRSNVRTKSRQPLVAEESFKVPAIPQRFNPTPAHPTSHPFTPIHPHTPHSIASFNPLVMSTPAYQQQQLHDGSFITTNMKTNDTSFYPPNDAASKKHQASNMVSHSENEELEQELLQFRVLQTTYLDVMSNNALRTQEEEAKNQLYTLWQAVEDNKTDLHVLQKNIVTEERNSTLDRALEVHLQSLGPLGAILPKFHQQYATLARSLDVTRNEMPVHGILPCTEDDVEAELMESEQVIGEIMTIIRDKVPKVSGFASILDTVLNTLEKEIKELKKCSKEFGKVTQDQLYESSLFFEEKQRHLLSQGHGASMPVYS